MAHLQPMKGNPAHPPAHEFKVFVGIDFGTDGSGMAFALKSNNKVYLDQDWGLSTGRHSDVKTRTNILLTSNFKFVAFGTDATYKYTLTYDDDSDDDDDGDNSSGSASDKLLLFENFKMKLYDKEILSHMTASNIAEEEKASQPGAQQPRQTVDIRGTVTAVNGAHCDSDIIFVEALKFMKEKAFFFFRKKHLDITLRDIQWILTVPAIWSNKAKHLMEIWATKAGMVDKNVPNHLRIAYEPDCASISIQYEINSLVEEHRKKRRSLGEDVKEELDNTNEKLSGGDKYVLCDLGGGTADIACHQIINQFAVKEIVHPTGGPWGSSYIDELFVQYLHDVFPTDWMSEFQHRHPNVYANLLQLFRSAKISFYERERYENPNAKHKRHISGSSQKSSGSAISTRPETVSGIRDSFMRFSDFCVETKEWHNISIPFIFINFMEEKLEEYRKNNARLIDLDIPLYEDLEDLVADYSFHTQKGLWVLQDDKLRLHYSVWRLLFDSVANKIINHCKMLLDTQPCLMGNSCKYMCLVGGFSGCKYLQYRMRYEFGVDSPYGLLFVIPNRPILSVVDGAARLGFQPTYIRERRVAKTYGIKVNAPLSNYDTSKLDPILVKKNVYWNKRTHRQYLHNILHPFVRKGDPIATDAKPVAHSFFAAASHLLTITLYESDERNPVFVPKLKLASKDLSLPPNWDMHQKFPIYFHFGDTQIRVYADIDGIARREKEINLDYQFE